MRSVGHRLETTPRFLRTTLLVAWVGVLHPTETPTVIAGEPASAESTQGLLVTLVAPSATWHVGTVTTFDATLKNVSQAAFWVDLFGDVNEIYQGKRGNGYMPSCWALSWEDGLNLPGPTRGRYTLQPDQFLRLSPGESTTKHLSVHLSQIPPGTHRIRLAYVPRAASPSFSFPDRWQQQHGLRDPVWVGMAFSDELTVHVVVASAFSKQRSAEALP